MEIAVIETDKNFRSTKVQYELTEEGETPSLRSVLIRYDPRLSKENARVAFGTSRIFDWDVSLRFCTLFGNEILLSRIRIFSNATFSDMDLKNVTF